MPKCRYHQVCGRDAIEDTGEELCILHSHIPGKDQKAFDEALATHRKTNGDDFRYFVFTAHTTNFRFATFDKGADFTSAAFAVAADFSNAKFEDVKFTNATFKGIAVFKDVTFKEADFSRAKFQQANFLDAKFTELAGFCNSMFTGQADFTGATFIGLADFSNARFEEACFGSATFKEGNFHAVSFEEAYFEAARFTNVSYFFSAEFKKAHFNSAEFKEADFRLATFTAKSDFSFATFKGVDFDGATFTGEADFCHARFLGRTLFSRGRTRTLPIFSGCEVDFRQVVVDPLNSLTFRDADLQKCRFQGTDLRKAEITGAIWPPIISKKWPERIRKWWDKIVGIRRGVYDQIEAEQRGETDDYSHIEQLYRQLKQNYEDRRDYERARDFHYGEKEMRRRNPDTPWGLWILLSLYNLVSGYGERCLRPLICAAVLLGVFTFSYLRWSLVRFGGDAVVTPNCENLRAVALYSFRVMTLLRPDEFVPLGCWGTLINTLQSIFGPILLGLFALALRQRLKR